MKRLLLVLCAMAALGAGAVAQDAQASRTDGPTVVGTAAGTDETALVIADPARPTPAGTRSSGPNTFVYFLRMVLVLILVLGAIYLVFRFMRGLSKPSLSSDPSIRLLASRSLGSNRALHVVSLGSTSYLIGAAENSINLLAEIGDKEYLDSLELKAQSQPAAAAGFSSIFEKMLKGKKRGSRGLFSGTSKEGPSSDEPRSDGFLAAQRDRLRKF